MVPQMREGEATKTVCRGHSGGAWLKIHKFNVEAALLDAETVLPASQQTDLVINVVCRSLFKTGGAQTNKVGAVQQDVPSCSPWRQHVL